MTTEFSTKATLDLQVDQGGLRSARKEIEEKLTGDPIQVEVEVEQPNSGRVASSSKALSSNTSASGGGGNGGSSKLLDRQNSLLSGIDSHWDENLELNDIRNELLRELLEETEKDNTTARGRMGRGLMGGGGMLGIAIGGAVLSKLPDLDLPKLKLPDIPPLKIPDIPPLKAPDIDPLEVPDIDPLKVPDIDPLEVPEIDPLEVPDIDPLEVPEIDPLEVPEIPGVPEPDWAPIEVRKPDWIPIPPPEMPEMPDAPGNPSPTPSPTPPPVAAPDGNMPDLPDLPDVNTPEISPGEAAAAGGTAAAGAAGWLAKRGGSVLGSGGGTTAGSKVATGATPVIDGAQLPDSMYPDGENPWKGQSMLERTRGAYQIFPGVSENDNPLRGNGDPPAASDPDTWKTTPTTGPSDPGTIDLDNFDIEGTNSGSVDLSQQSADRSTGSQSLGRKDLEELANQNVDITVKPNINVSADGVSKKDVEREVKDATSKVESEVSRRLDKLERAFEW